MGRRCGGRSGFRRLRDRTRSSPIRAAKPPHLRRNTSVQANGAFLKLTPPPPIPNAYPVTHAVAAGRRRGRGKDHDDVAQPAAGHRPVHGAHEPHTPRPRRARARVLGLAGALLVVTASAAPARAATFTVNTQADVVPGLCTSPTGGCSLREAINAANGTGAGDTIVLPAGKYLLSAATGGTLSITRPLDIRGAGARATVIDGGDAGFRVLRTASTGGISISGLTVTGGRDTQGAGIYNTGVLDLASVAVTGNTAVSATGGAYGGGIANVGGSASLRFNGGTVSANTAAGRAAGGVGRGGGVYVSGVGAVAMLTNVTISGNVAGGRDTPGDGGGVYTGAGAATALASVTLAGNVAGGGTGAGRGGSVYTASSTTSQGTTSAGNTIFAWGTVHQGRAQNCAGSAVSDSGGNLDTGATCLAGGLVDTDPLLGDLRANGGDTDVHALAPDSPAINAGTSVGCPASDQRGIARPYEGRCDIGSYEATPAADVSIAVSAASAPVAPGVPMTVTVRVANAGPAPATGVSARFELPPSLRLRAARPGQGSCEGTVTITCNLGAIGSGAGVAVDLVLEAPAPGVFAITASAGAPRVDPGLANNIAAVTASVVAPEVTAAPAPAPTDASRRSGAAAADDVAPSIALAKLSSPRFTPGAASSARTRFRFSVSEDSLVTVVIEQVLPGRRIGGRCDAPTAGNRRRARCVRFLRRGVITADARAGRNSLAFSGRVAGRALAPGTYRAHVVATDGAGNRSAARRIAFTILARR